MTTEEHLKNLERAFADKEPIGIDTKINLVNAITACRQQIAITELVELLKNQQTTATNTSIAR